MSVLSFLVLPGVVQSTTHVETNLVRAKVISIEPDKPSVSAIATLEIVHVYYGDKELVSKKFTDLYNAQDFRGTSASTPFIVDEEGIWNLMITSKGISLGYDSRMPFRYRSRKSDQRHNHIVALAEAIEKFDLTKPDRSISMLYELAVDRTPEVSAWAVRKLGDSKSESARKFIDSFAEKPKLDLPIAGQVAMDEVLAKCVKEDWLESKARTSLMRSWVDTKQDEFHAKLILSRIDMADQISELPNKTAVELTRIAAENKNWPWAVRRYAISQVGAIASRGVNDEPAYIWLFDQVRKNEDIEVRRAAVNTLTYNFTLYPARLKAFEEHLLFEKDTEIKKAMQAAITKEKTRKSP